jgi:hypothetical protein
VNEAYLLDILLCFSEHPPPWTSALTVVGDAAVDASTRCGRRGERFHGNKELKT